MKKKFIIALIAAVLFGSTSAFAKTGLGVQGGTSLGAIGGGGVALTFKLESLPAVFAVNANFGSEHLFVGGTADWWIQNPNISGPVKWYYGVGLAVGTRIDDGVFTIGAGPRALIGVNAILVNDFIELYLQGAWQPMIWIGSPFGFDLVNFPINFGIRFWF